MGFLTLQDGTVIHGSQLPVFDDMPLNLYVVVDKKAICQMKRYQQKWAKENNITLTTYP